MREWLCCVLVPVLFGYTVAIYLALCGPLYIVAYRMCGLA